MSTAQGWLLAVGIFGMIGLVVYLVRLNARTVQRQHLAAATRLSMEDVDDAQASEALVDAEIVWRSADQERRSWGHLRGTLDGWPIQTFFFAHDSDEIDAGARTAIRVLTDGMRSLAWFATDWRTAQQRAVLVPIAMAHPEGGPATFKLRGHKVIARNARGRELLARIGPLRLVSHAPPARITLSDGWLLLHSFYVAPKWIDIYVTSAAQLCSALAEHAEIARPAESPFEA